MVPVILMAVFPFEMHMTQFISDLALLNMTALDCYDDTHTSSGTGGDASEVPVSRLNTPAFRPDPLRRRSWSQQGASTRS
jgi:hypothetical protein